MLRDMWDATKTLILFTLLILVLAISLVYGVEALKDHASMTEGTVVEKEFIAAHTVHTHITMTSKVGNTTSIRMIPVIHHYDDDWTITVEGYNRKGDLKQRTFHIDEKTYNKIEVGDHYVYDEEKDSLEAPYEEVRI